jgi:hypothetical protein
LNLGLEFLIVNTIRFEEPVLLSNDASPLHNVNILGSSDCRKQINSTLHTPVVLEKFSDNKEAKACG